MKRIEKVFNKIAIPTIIIAVFLLVFLFIRLNDTSKSVAETSAYTRVSNCIVAKLAGATIPQKEIELCYVQVEKETGISLERFDRQAANYDRDTAK